MYKKILACMDIKNGKVVKGVQFESIREVGDILEFAKYYSDTGADELAYYDIGASVNETTLFYSKLKEVSNIVGIPLIAGGGLSSIERCQIALESGADKLSINTGAIKDRGLIRSLANRYGSDKIILSADIKKTKKGYEIFTKAGSVATGINAIDWLKKAEDDGASEVVVNSIDTDGMKMGYDLPLLETVLNNVKIDVVASGGAGKVEHFIELFTKLPNISTALGASVFHFREINIDDLKKELLANGIQVKI